MEQMGIDMDEFDAERVTVDLADGDRLVFEGPEVTKMEARGQSTYMVVGDPDRQESADAAAELDDGASDGDDESTGTEIPEDDVTLVATRTGASAEDAREALENEDGDLAAAIARLE
jgi:nascent polypeptide-associated complex subunit alpha